MVANDGRSHGLPADSCSGSQVSWRSRPPPEGDLLPRRNLSQNSRLTEIGQLVTENPSSRAELSSQLVSEQADR